MTLSDDNGDGRVFHLAGPDNIFFKVLVNILLKQPGTKTIAD